MILYIEILLHNHCDGVALPRQGFHSDDDEEVLGGSCALEFTLTHAGKLRSHMLTQVQSRVANLLCTQVEGFSRQAIGLTKRTQNIESMGRMDHFFFLRFATPTSVDNASKLFRKLKSPLQTLRLEGREKTERNSEALSLHVASPDHERY